MAKSKEEKTEESKKVKYLQIPLPEELYDQAIDAYYEMFRVRAMETARASNKTLSEEDLNKLKAEDVVITTIKKQILSALERKVQTAALENLQKKY